MTFARFTVLTLPGHEDSGPEHWQSHWERAHGFSRVVQADGLRPRPERGNAALERCLEVL